MKGALFTYLILFALTVSSLAGAGEAVSDKLDLRLHFEKGQTFQCTRTVNTTCIAWSGVAEGEVTISTISTRTLEVLSMDEEGTATIKVTSDRVLLSWRSPSVEIEYDSDTVPIEEAHRGVLPTAAMVGRCFTVKVTPTGEVCKVEGNELLREALADALAKRDPEGQAVEMAEDHYTDEAIEKLMVSLVFPVGLYPAEPIAVEDSWTLQSVHDARLTNTLLAKKAYRLTSRRDGIATVSCEAAIEPDANAGPSSPTVRSVFSGKEESTFQIDEKTGMIIEAQTSLELKGELLTRETPEAEEETSEPATIETTISLKVEQKTHGVKTE